MPFKPQTKQQLETAVDGWTASTQTITKSTPVPSGQGNGTYGPMGTWDVSLIDNMGGLFANKMNFNEDISDWDVSKVTDMSYMFVNTRSFNNGDTGNNGLNPLNKWDVSKVTDMSSMFFTADAFNQDISGWERQDGVNGAIGTSTVGNVKNMRYMFSDAAVFNQDITGWNVGNVTRIDRMFRNAGAFNQNIKKWLLPVTGTDRTQMFTGATAMIATYGSDPHFGTSPNYSPNRAFFNYVPTFTSIPVTAVIVGQSYSYDPITTNDANGDTVTLTATTKPSWLTLTGTALTGPAPSTAGSHTVLLTATDSNGGTATQSFTITVASPSGFKPQTKQQLVDAVNGWTASPQTIIQSTPVPTGQGTGIYGNIGDWDVSLITDMEELFYTKSTFNDDISGWDVCSVTNMRWMFEEAAAFNQDISSWDVSSVTDMTGMFFQATAFNQLIGNWNVSSVTDMSYMFYQAGFNQPIGSWERQDGVNGATSTSTVGNVTNMQQMFRNADNFNQPIGNWNVSSVINMRYMFLSADDFNQPIGDWNVSQVTNMSYMFYYTPFDQPIGNWNVSNVTDMHNMFQNAQTFNQDLSGWERQNGVNGATSTSTVANVVDMDDMFRDAIAFNGDISTWNVSNVTDMSSMFYNARAFNGNISNWERQDGVNGATSTSTVGNVTNMAYMFWNAAAFNADISSWNVSQVTTMNAMFAGAAAFNQNIKIWTPSSTVVLTDMFIGATAMIAAYGSSDPNFANTPQRAFFEYAPIFTSTPLNKVLVNAAYSAVVTTSHQEGSSKTVTVTATTKPTWLSFDGTTLSGPVPSDVGTHQVVLTATDNNSITTLQSFTITVSVMSGFKPRTKQQLVDAVNGWTASPQTITSTTTVPTGQGTGVYGNIGDWDVSLITNMEELFRDKGTFNEFIGNWDVSNVTNMDSMFYKAHSFNRDISNWEVSKVTDMEAMFREASAFNQDISGWDVSKVTNMDSMFFGASAFNQPIGTWNVSQVTDMYAMFELASTFNGNISGWERQDGVNGATSTSTVGNVTTMVYMFYGAAAFNQPIGNWNVSKVDNMYGMFVNASAFNQDIGQWNVSQVISMKYMFYNAAAFNKDLSGWERQDGVNGAIGTSTLANVTNMYAMFYRAAAFNGDISTWNVSQVTDMQIMFYNADAFNADISSWNVSQVTSMFGMFYNAFRFNQNIKVWTPSPSVELNSMFAGATAMIAAYGSSDPNFASTPQRGFFEYAPAFTSTPLNKLLVNSTYNSVVTTSHGSSSTVTVAATTKPTWLSFDGTTLSGTAPSVEGTHSVVLTATDTNSNTTVQSFTITVTVSRFQPQTKLQLRNAILGWVSGTITATTLVPSGQGLGNYENINMWDVSLITDMEDLFNGMTTFDEDISGWNVSNVIRMRRMFAYSNAFNQDISGWDVSKVTDMAAMFREASAFNQDISGWDVSKVTDMDSMFRNASAFNQPLAMWERSSVGNTSTVGNVTKMRYMFSGASSFNQDISDWNVSNVINMDSMFRNAIVFNQPLAMWERTTVGNTSTLRNVTNMNGMFRGASAFNQNIGFWDTSSVTSFSEMFSGSLVFKTSFGNASLITTNNSTTYANSDGTFKPDSYTYTTTKSWGGFAIDSEYLNLPLKFAYAGTITFNGYASSDVNIKFRFEKNAYVNTGCLDPKQTTDFYETSEITISPSQTSYSVTIPSQGANEYRNVMLYVVTQNVPVTINGMSINNDTTSKTMNFNKNITPLLVDTFANLGYMIDNTGIQSGNAYNLTVPTPLYTEFNKNATFQPQTKQQLLDAVNGWTASPSTVTATTSIPSGQGRGSYGEMNTWDVSLMTDLSYVFKDKTTFNEDITGWVVTAAENMTGLFQGATSFNQPIGNWERTNPSTMANVQNMSYMFSGASKFDQDISNWNVSSVQDMSYMFKDASKFTNNPTAWKAANPTRGTNLLDTWGQPNHNPDSTKPAKIASVVNFTSMFENATSFDSRIVGWPVNAAADLTNMVKNSGLSNNDSQGQGFLGETTPALSLFGQTVCFNKGTKILCWRNKKDKYIAVEDLRRGDLIKTLDHGYKPISVIKYTVSTLGRKVDMGMFKMKKSGNMIADLEITGLHAVLVDKKEPAYENDLAEQDKYYKSEYHKQPIDGKTRLRAMFSTAFEKMPTKEYTSYTFALDEEQRQYGVWANGVLVETTSHDIISLMKDSNIKEVTEITQSQ